MHRCPIAEIPVYAYMISLEAEIKESDWKMVILNLLVYLIRCKWEKKTKNTYFSPMCCFLNKPAVHFLILSKRIMNVIRKVQIKY